jgi:hypothetical protein
MVKKWRRRRFPQRTNSHRSLGIKTGTLLRFKANIFLVSDCVIPVYDSLKGAAFEGRSKPLKAMPRFRLNRGDRMAPESCNEFPASEPANPNAVGSHAVTRQSREEEIEERRKIRRLQLMMDMVMSVIGQDPNLTIDEAAEMVADSRRAALAMFPDKELAFNILYKPRLQRLMRERYRIQ